MSEEKINDIQELIERKILLAEVSGGLTSSDRKFIDLWNYTVDLQQRIQKAIEYIKENDNSELGIYQTKFIGKDKLIKILKGDKE